MSSFSAPPDPAFSLRIPTAKTLAVLGWIAVGWVGIHVALTLIHYRMVELPWLFRQIFDVDEEDSFPTWYSAFLLLLTAVSLGLQWAKTRQVRPADAGPWALLAGGFLILSVDEIAGMHETLNSVTEYSWTLPGAIGAAVVAVYFGPFLRRLPRAIAGQFMIAGAIYLGGALGVEFMTDPYLENDALNTLGYNLWTAVEEAMEMGGVLVFLDGLRKVFLADRVSQPVQVVIS